MWTTYLKLAARSLWKDKGTASMMTLGLAVGLAVSCLVFALLWGQRTHDTGHPGADRLVRVTSMLHGDDGSDAFASSPAGLAPLLRTQVSGVEAATRLRRGPSSIVRLTEDELRTTSTPKTRQTVLYAEPSFFDLFGFEKTPGAAEQLSEPNTLLLSQESARVLFDASDPVGKTVQIPSVGPVTVAGVVDTDAVRSHLTFDALLSLSTLDSIPETGAADWRQSADAYYTYARLAPGASRESVQEAANALSASFEPGAGPDIDGRWVEALEIQPVGDIMIQSIPQNEIAGGVLPLSLAYLLNGLALVVLVTAGFNYVNLSIARGMTRGQEVGVRKTLGARREQVMTPFLVESVVVALAALAIGLAVLVGISEAFNRMWVVQRLGIDLDLNFGLAAYAACTGFAVLVGLVAGLYPAWKLSGFPSADVIRNQLSTHAEKGVMSWLTSRKALIVAQFTLSVVVGVTAIVFLRQAQHMQSADYGFDVQNKLLADLGSTKIEQVRSELRGQADIERVSAANYLPMSGATQSADVRTPLQADAIDVVYYACEAGFLDQLAVEVVAGTVDPDRFDTGRTIVINERAVRTLGYDAPSDAVGQVATVRVNNQEIDARITAVTANFYYSFLGEGVDPILFQSNPDLFVHAVVEHKAGAGQAARTQTLAVLNRLAPTRALSVERADAIVERFTAPFVDGSRILGFTAFAAVVISIVGLLGLAFFAMRSRRREIGVRRALGATVRALVVSLSSQYVGLIGVSLLLGLPLAWFANRLWLQQLSVRVDVGAATLGGSALALLIVTLLALLPQTVRTAMTNPASVLRDE